MNLQKEYSYTNNRQIWRLLPTETSKIIIEERDVDTKEVYFSCLDIASGEKIFNAIQLEEKFWIGIETIQNDIIFFHRFLKPDMRGHRGIIAFDISTKKVAWENPEYSFLFILDNKIYCCQQFFDGKKFFSLDSSSGKLVEELGSDSERINYLQEKALGQQSFEDYIFPEVLNVNEKGTKRIKEILNSLKNEIVLTGPVEYTLYSSFLLFTANEVLQDGKMKNVFRAIDLNSGKILLEQSIFAKTDVFITDSFFIKSRLLFLLIGKTGLVVYSFKG